MSDSLLIDPGQHDPKRVAVIHHKQPWTYGEFERRSLRLARSLAAAGVEPGDRVAILLANCPEAVLLYLACFRAGFTIVPLDERYIAAQINFAVKHCGAKVLVTSTKRLPDVEQSESAKQVEHLLITGPDCPETHRSFRAFVQTRSSTEISESHRGDDVAIVFYTSGTTSRPKGVTLTRDAVEAGIQKAAAVLRLNSKDVTLIAAPIARPFALRTQLLPTLTAGGTVKLHSRFDPDRYVRDLQRKPVVSFLALLPIAVRKMLEHPDLNADDLSNVRLFICGGDRVPLDLFDRIRELAGIELVEQCGMTETGMYAVNPPYGRKKPGSIGLPFYGTQVAIWDEQGRDVPWTESGEIAVRSSFTMDGYWNYTAETRKVMRDGWIRTGDIGRIDDDGYLWLIGRKKDIIVRGGSNISPAAIEAVLLPHPSVADACVVGRDDMVFGQVAYAFVTVLPGETAMQVESELQEIVERELPDYMVPAGIMVLDEMPRTGSGKVDRQRLKWIADAQDENATTILLS